MATRLVSNESNSTVDGSAGQNPLNSVEQAGSRSDADVVDCKVVVLTHYLPPYMARVLYHLGQHVRELQVLLSIAQEPNRQFGDTWKGLSVTVQKSWMFRRPWKHSTGFTDELYVHVPYDTLSQLRKADPDIVFSYELGFRSLASALYAKFHRKPLALCVCVSEHTEQGRGLFRHWLRRFLLKTASAVTFNGPSCRRYLQAFGVPDEKLFHYPYSTSDLFRYEGPIERSEAASKRLLCVGQLSERKGVLPMVEAISAYCQSRPSQRVELDLVGTGPLEDELRRMELPENFELRLLGHKTYESLCEIMAGSGVSIFPTMADEWGLVVNEALQAGMPVIGSKYAQASTTLIREAENGWVYRPDHPEELHEKLDRLFALPYDRLEKMRFAATESVAHITTQNVAQQAADMFRCILANAK